MMTPKTYMLFLVAGLFLLYAPADAENNSADPSDHIRNMKGPYPNGISVTKDCLKCHSDEGKEILESAHWLWEGPTPFIEGYKNHTGLGKKNLMNNF
ncbi:MAG: hypothetical protein P8X67_18430 [Syntrophobacterales bacterium]|jgi:hypothetical protein